MASYNGVLAAVISRPGCRLILAMFLLTTKNTRVRDDYPRSYSQALCRACQHWGLAGFPLWHSQVPAGDITYELYCSYNSIALILTRKLITNLTFLMLIQLGCDCK